MINDLIWFGIRSDSGRPILERVKTNQCKKCNGFGTYGNPLCGAVYSCKRCKGSGNNFIKRFWYKLLCLKRKLELFRI